MADPISLMAIAALVYTGRKLSTTPKSIGPSPMVYEDPKLSVQPPSPKKVFEDSTSPIGPRTMETEIFSDVDLRQSTENQREVPHKVETKSFANISAQHRSGGQEVLNMRNRLYDQGRMNNLSPVEKQMVGPGLGVGSHVPAAGGYQQMFRVNPINVGEYRLTTLPGRSGPAADVTGGRGAVVGELTHNKPDTSAYLPTRLPAMPGRAQGMSGVVPRNEHEKTKRTTNRSETGLREDGLGFNGAKRFVSAQTISQDPTRFKTDRNDTQFAHYNQPAPGISNFRGAYTNSAAVQVTDKTNEELMRYGFCPEDRRGKANRMGNPGRMNVRESAGKQGGKLTTVRSDTSRIDGRINAASGGWTQNYKKVPFHQFNSYKGNENPHSKTLDVAQRQLQNNPLAHSLSVS